MKAAQLEKLLHQEIPITGALEVSVAELDADRIVIRAPLSPNRNIHQTGFAGSIYSVATLAGWSLVTHVLDEAKVPADVVMASADIRYRRPLRGDLVAHCSWTDKTSVDAFLAQLSQRGKARLPLTIEVKDADEVYALLTGQFVALTTS